MAETRHKDADWNLGEKPTWDGAQLAVLMDLRDEIKRLNSLLYCPNFIAIPRILREIRRNTTKAKRKASPIKPKARRTA
jgi:hypothetical protein